MNELDALRQEAETLKNAIRVSTQTPATFAFFRYDMKLNCNFLLIFRMHEKQHATPAWCRRRIIWNQLDAYKCVQDAHYVVI